MPQLWAAVQRAEWNPEDSMLTFDVDDAYRDPSNGKPLNEAAAKLWAREYEPGWEPTV